MASAMLIARASTRLRRRTLGRTFRQASDQEREIAWLSDLTRAFVLALAESESVGQPLDPFAHLGVACESHEDVDRLCERARSEGCLRREPSGYGVPAGYLAFLADPDGHTLELSYGQEMGLAVEDARKD